MSRPTTVLNACHSRANGPVKRLFNLVTRELFARSSFSRGNVLGRKVPTRGFDSVDGLHPNSVGCGSLGKSNRIATMSGATVNNAHVPRVICNFKTAMDCGSFSLKMFFRKANGACRLLNKRA